MLDGKIKKVFNVVMSLILSIIMTISTLLTPLLPGVPGIVSLAAVNDGGFELSLDWIEDGKKTRDYIWDSVIDEERYVRLRISYSNREAVKNGTAPGYEAGDLVITVPGIGDAYRGKMAWAYDVAADRSDAADKIRIWNYTYNPESDVYTFTNNKKVGENSSFDGYFEIVWDFSSRLNVGAVDGKEDVGWNKKFSSVMRGPGSVKLESNQVTYHYTSKKDHYELQTAEIAQILGGAGMTVPDGGSISDYIWVSYYLNGVYEMKARGTQEKEYYDITLPPGAVIGRAAEKIDTTDSYYSAELPVKQLSASPDNVWRIWQDIDWFTCEEWMKLYVGYPNSMAGQEVVMEADLKGIFYDTLDREENLGHVEKKYNLKDYGYAYPSGDMYAFEKCVNSGDFTDQHEKLGIASKENHYLTTEKVLKNRVVNKSFYLNSQVLYGEKNRGNSESYSLEFVDDFLDAKTKGGDLRKLEPGEYEFSSVKIPPVSQIINTNGVTLKPDTYSVSVYAMYGESGNWEMVDRNTRTLKLKASGSDAAKTEEKETVREETPKKPEKDIEKPSGKATDSEAEESINTSSQGGDEAANERSTEAPVSFDAIKRADTSTYFSAFGSDHSKASVEGDLTGKTPDKTEPSVSEGSAQNAESSAHETVPESTISTTESSSSAPSQGSTSESGEESTEESGEDITIESTEDSTENAEVGEGDNTADKPDNGEDIPGSPEEGTEETGDPVIGDGTALDEMEVVPEEMEEMMDLEAVPIEEEYTCLLNNTIQTIPIGNGATRVKIVVNRLKEAAIFRTGIGCNVTFTLKDDSDLPEEEQIDDSSSGSVKNNSFLRVLFNYSDGSQTWINTDGSYSDQDILNRDLDNYQDDYGLSANGKLLHRDDCTVFVKPQRSEYYTNIYTDGVKTDYDRFGYQTPVELSTIFNYTEPDSLEEFTMYTILPRGMEILPHIWNPSGLLEACDIRGTGFDSVWLKNQCEVEYIKNYRGSGRTYLAFHFKLSRPALGYKGTIYVRFNSYISNDAAYIYGSGSCSAVTMIYDDVPNLYESIRKAQDNGDYSDDSQLYRDINNDGKWDDRLSYYNAKIRYHVTAQEGHVGVTEYIWTEYTNGRYIQTDESGGGEAVADTSFSHNYRYRLMFENGGELSVSDIVFFDHLEMGNGHGDTTYAQWKGTFVGVDTSYVESLGLKPQVYYSQSSSPGQDLTSGQWSKTAPADLSQVKSVAFDFKNAEMETGDKWHVEIEMKAPASISMKDKTAEDSFYVNGNYLNPGYSQSIGQLPSNAIRVKLTSGKGNLVLIKRDKTDQSPIQGAKFDLYQMDGLNKKLIKSDLVTSSTGRIEVQKLEYGTYYFRETEAPKGYEMLTSDVTAVLTGDGSMVTKTVEVFNTRKKGQVTLTKKSAQDTSQLLKGAVFTLKKDGVSIKTGLTTDTNGQIKVTALDWGSYEFVETKAPDGYELSDKSFAFTVSQNNVENMIEVTALDDQKPVSFKFIKKEVLEDGTTHSGKPVENAVYKLYRKAAVTGDLLLQGTYVTDVNGEIYADKLVYGSYVLKETQAPAGYYAHGDVNFEVKPSDAASGLIKLEGTDTRKAGQFSLAKVNELESPVAGAEFTLYRANTEGGGQPVWDKVDTFVTNEEGKIEVKRYEKPGDICLKWGSYKLEETAFPKGYEHTPVLETFVINADNADYTVTIDVVNTRAKGSVKLIKYEKGQEDNRLDGAVYTLYAQDGSVIKDDLTTATVSSTVKDPVTGAETAVDETGVIVVNDLEWGSYYFKEKTAPSGYSVSDEMIRFSINYLTAGSENIQVVEAGDEREKREITVTKKIKKEDVIFAHGNPSFTFKVEGNNGKTYYRGVNFSPKYLEGQQADRDGYVSQSVIFAGLESGYSYKVTEVDSIRYSLDQVEASSVAGVQVSGDAVTADLGDQNKGQIVEAIFTNARITDAGASDTSQSTNIIKMGRKVTALLAEYSGDILTTDSVDETKLDVYAVYDDGSQEKLAVGEYKIEGLEGGMESDSSYTLYAVYENNGKTWKAPFGVRTGTLSLFTWKVLSEIDKTVAIKGYTGKSKYVKFPATVQNQYGTVYKVVAVGAKEYGTAGGKIDGLENVEAISFSEGIITIEKSAFRGMINLKGDLTFPSTITSIEDYAFAEIRGFVGTLTIPGNVKSLGYGAFDSFGGSGNVTRLTIEEGIEKIGPFCFNRSKIKGDLVLPDSITEIGDSAFSECGIPGTLVLPSKLKIIPDSAFGGLNSRGQFTGSLVLPESVESVGKYAFNECKFSGNLKIPSNVTEIRDQAFEGCTQISSLEFSGDSLKLIGDNAFRRWAGLKGQTLTVPDSVEKLGSGAFAYTYLSGFVLGTDNSHLEDIGSSVFDSASFSGVLKIPNSVKVLRSDAFKGAGWFSDIIFGTGLVTIESNALSRFTSQALNGKTIKLPDSLMTIESNGFYWGGSGSTIEEIIIPPSLTNIVLDNKMFGSAKKYTIKSNCQVTSLSGVYKGKAIVAAYPGSSAAQYALANPDSFTFEPLSIPKGIQSNTAIWGTSQPQQPLPLTAITAAIPSLITLSSTDNKKRSQRRTS